MVAGVTFEVALFVECECESLDAVCEPFPLLAALLSSGAAPLRDVEFVARGASLVPFTDALVCREFFFDSSSFFST